ncbi:hypothetical protein GCM10011344_31820 [Dokdonia pacifica]|uniref:Uncharacterized protein n=1 Tax=Dokdonia pacifica TaxID=1627892 RepID=A0A239BL92_9FLAO|nr:hypothetical protein [Dokdonia pacifica]GGG28698.1 hypothetical protein GCM10011344_31820 [Dokdonia pacifica]SNS08915.1 hypothetical protein SAMN06265376_106287 [Dokdonia pacifica]
MLFQEDLIKQVNGSISEKSFYTYFKNEPKKLPRIDVLNLLSRYTGASSWSAFSKEQKITTQEKKKTNSLYKYIGIGLLLIVTILVLMSSYFKTENTFRFCFIDTDRGAYINTIPLDITILNNNQSPTYIKSDSLGCFSWKAKADYIQFIVQSPYHKTDTIKRHINTSITEDIPLRTDDYNLMLHFYANNKVNDWKKRKQQLHQLIAKNAILIQVLPYDVGVEMYTKEEFIDKLTTPTKSLQRFEIIESIKEGNQIVKLKFRTSHE